LPHDPHSPRDYLLTQALRHPMTTSDHQPAYRAYILDSDGRIRLTAESIEFEPMRRGLNRIQASLILLDHPRRVVEQPTDLPPDRLVEPINRHQPSITSPGTMEPGPVGAATAIVAPRPAGLIPRESIAAFLTDQQASQQVLSARRRSRLRFRFSSSRSATLAKRSSSTRAGTAMPMCCSAAAGTCR
jgi:hypothetical protein